LIESDAGARPQCASAGGGFDFVLQDSRLTPGLWITQKDRLAEPKRHRDPIDQIGIQDEVIDPTESTQHRIERQWHPEKQLGPNRPFHTPNPISPLRTALFWLSTSANQESAATVFAADT